MPSFLAILSWVLLAGALAALVFWIIVWYRISQVVAERPTVRTGLDSPEPEPGWPRVSIVIPAHNERRVIDACAASLRRQNYPTLEIIFVLDRCTDETRDLLRPHEQADPRIVVIENDHSPDDWAGKCHAAQLGAERATGEWLLFTDADTEFDPDLCRAAVALAIEREVNLLSLLSSLTFDHLYERIAQPVAGMNLVRMYPLRRVQSGGRARPFANGQFMLFDRAWYEKLGRHKAVREDLLEDLAFARRLHEMNGRSVTLLADGMLRCSMYDSLASFQSGWKRIFIEACGRSPRRLRKNGWRVLANGVGVPLVQLAGVVTAAVLVLQNEIPGAIILASAVLAGVLVQAVSLVRVYRMSGAPISGVILYPVGCWILGRIMLDAARDLNQRRPVRWGGRQYVLEPRP